MTEEISRLKKEKNAIIMAHYYVADEIQDIADFVGDSFFLAKKATETDADIIVLCGVRFMGESAKILNPTKKVLIPEIAADCPMAHMATTDGIAEIRDEYDDLAVVCYVNSTADLKAASDVCVTSANALKIVKNLPQKNIYFIPDQNLAHFIADQLPEKHFIFNNGFCHVHNSISLDSLKKTRALKPDAPVLVHPECKPEVVAEADFVGSTSGIIKYATESDQKEFIVATELGVMHELKKRNPDKTFYPAGPMQICPNMKKLTLEKLLHVLKYEDSEITLPENLMKDAKAPMEEMLRLAK
ncbi:MAG: quinolinate synthase NadA [Lachnospiraceae bacterium]|uniref:Quinolinate synthase n=1 Tax=Candidatus Weimeria bifida TaxID=2599074 RepID=A0A6N7J3W4_9FIRM|nr:quinolinate synthase NadA [Candidatus Weimeria bifida]RRF97447.1 MAG: quinolinate synthase NadA [Lachnospiraceae bacterium]